MQGVAELSYLMLQHYTIASTSKERIPLRVHGHFFALLLNTSEEITPRPITPAFGSCAKETHPHSKFVASVYVVWSRRLLVVCVVERSRPRGTSADPSILFVYVAWGGWGGESGGERVGG